MNLHLLWGKAQNHPEDYNKQEWETLQAYVEGLERDRRELERLKAGKIQDTTPKGQDHR